jgi:uncharacterized protein YcbK (DUF882 family)
MRRIAPILLATLVALPAVAAPAKKKSAAFSGHNAPKEKYRTEPLPKPSGHISLRNENLGEEVVVDIYKADGSFDEGALAKLDELFRCLNTGEIRAMRAELYEQLSRIQDHFDGKQVLAFSGFRLTDNGSSRHYHASAMDFRIKGVSIYELKKFAETLDTGNMGLGIYPNSDFVHLDVRAPGEPSYYWTDTSGPRSLFPKAKAKSPGRTQPARKPTS